MVGGSFSESGTLLMWQNTHLSHSAALRFAASATLTNPDYILPAPGHSFLLSQEEYASGLGQF